MQSLKFGTGNGQNALGECTSLSPSCCPPFYVFPWPLRVSSVIPLPCFLASPCKVTNMTISMVMCSQWSCDLNLPAFSGETHLQPSDTHFILQCDETGLEESLGCAQYSEFWLVSLGRHIYLPFRNSVGLGPVVMVICLSILSLYVRNPQSSDIYKFLCAGIMPGVGNLIQWNWILCTKLF